MTEQDEPSRDLSPCDCTTVEAATNLAFVKGCLQLMQSLEFFQAYKERSFNFLEIRDAARVLEIGCGLGEDAVSMAKRVGVAGLVAAIDKSHALLVEASAQPAGHSTLRFGAADVCNLPFQSGQFDAVRVDRTLQHVHDVDGAIGEMVRVSALGGVVLAIEPDWETLLVDSDDLEATRVVVQTFCESLPNSRVGRTLRRRFVAAGLSDVEVWPETFTTSDFGTGNEVFHVERTLQTCLDAGQLSEARATRWLAELTRRGDAQQFFGSLTLYMVRGRKPR